VPGRQRAPDVPHVSPGPDRIPGVPAATQRAVAKSQTSVPAQGVAVGSPQSGAHAPAAHDSPGPQEQPASGGASTEPASTGGWHRLSRQTRPLSQSEDERHVPVDDVPQEARKRVIAASVRAMGPQDIAGSGGKIGARLSGPFLASRAWIAACCSPGFLSGRHTMAREPHYVRFARALALAGSLAGASGCYQSNGPEAEPDAGPPVADAMPGEDAGLTCADCACAFPGGDLSDAGRTCDSIGLWGCCVAVGPLAPPDLPA
jgi:hypothetical protein